METRKVKENYEIRNDFDREGEGGEDKYLRAGRREPRKVQHRLGKTVKRQLQETEKRGQLREGILSKERGFVERDQGNQTRFRGESTSKGDPGSMSAKKNCISQKDNAKNP